MKKTLFTLITIITFLITLTACASTEKPPRQRDDTFIADINSFTLDTVHLYTQRKTGKPKINDLVISFDPRTNYVNINTKIGIDFVKIGLSYEERKSLFDAYNKYIEALYSNGIPNEKPTKKNAYTKGYAFVYWGAAGLSYGANAPYMTNAYYMEPTKPYFRITFSAGADEEEHVYSPSFSVYISPTQWETLIEMCNQEHLVALTDEILAQANEF